MTLARDLNTILEDITMADPRPPEALELTTQAGTRVYEAWWQERAAKIAAKTMLKVTQAQLTEATAQGITESERHAQASKLVSAQLSQTRLDLEKATARLNYTLAESGEIDWGDLDPDEQTLARKWGEHHPDD